MIFGDNDAFQLSKQESAFVPAIGEIISRRHLTVNDFEFDEFSTYWRDIVNVTHSHSGDGRNELIAIIDSGYRSDWSVGSAIDDGRSVDLTGEGLIDSVGHGSAISAILQMLAPRAVQYHVKLFNARGRIPGKNYDDRILYIKRAFDHIEQVGATIVNISWNFLTTIERHPPNVRKNFLCYCPICQIFTEFVKRTNVDIFVSEGNFTDRPEGSWSCPAAAPLVVPVIGYQDGRNRYDTNIDFKGAVPAPARIYVPRRKGSMLRRLLSSLQGEMILTGTSYSTPIVAGTYAAIKSAFREHGETITIPRSFDGATRAPFTFPLDLFFVPPDEPEDYRYDRSDATAWLILNTNCQNTAIRLRKEGRLQNASELCFFLAQLLTVTFWRQKIESPFRVGVLALDLYRLGVGIIVSGIDILPIENLAFFGLKYIAEARRLLEALGNKYDRLDLEAFKEEFDGLNAQILRYASDRKYDVNWWVDIGDEYGD